MQTQTEPPKNNFPYVDGYALFGATKETLRDVLDKHGVAVIRGVIDATECEKMLSGAWDYIEALTSGFTAPNRPLKRDDPSTWIYFKQVYPSHSQLMQHHTVGHAQVYWNLRQNPKIAEIFAFLWFFDANATDKLLVSFDGASFCFPPEVINAEQEKITGKKHNAGWDKDHWLHTDQAFLKKDGTTNSFFQCVQSWVTANHVPKGAATLLAIPGSHKLHEEFGATFNLSNSTDEKRAKKAKEDWFKLEDDKQLQFFTVKHGLQPVKICCEAGDMVFWDSRTFHAGTNPVRGREDPVLRCVAYLCYTPRKWASAADLKKKKKYFEERRTTSHWPHKPKPFPKSLWTRGPELEPSLKKEFKREEDDPEKLVKPAIVSDFGLILAGFDKQEIEKMRKGKSEKEPEMKKRKF